MNRNMCTNQWRRCDCLNICVMPCCNRWQSNSCGGNTCNNYSSCQGESNCCSQQYNCCQYESSNYNECGNW